jgi:transcriptional regulator
VVFRDANLTCRQKEVVGYRMAGKTFEEIGALSGCSKQAILNVLRQACRKILRAQADYPFEGLAEVYEQETLRGRRTDRPGKLVR